MTLHTKESILGIEDSNIKIVEVAGWGDVFIRVMSGAERNTFEKICALAGTDDPPDSLREQLIVRCLCDGGGARLFADSEWPMLSGKSSLALEDLAQECMVHNRLVKDAAGN